MSRFHAPSSSRLPDALAADSIAGFTLVALMLLAASKVEARGAAPPDPHSAARPAEVAVRHIDLDLEVDFAARRLAGTAILRLDRKVAGAPLWIDTWGLTIESVTALPQGRPARFRVGPADAKVPVMGRPVSIDLPRGADAVAIRYATAPDATALQWLEPRQTRGGEHPFLFTQSQAILARSWIPLQDTPGVRFTYEATVRVPRGLLALMSAENPTAREPEGVYRFSMPQAIPSYLMALAVGDLAFRPLGPRSGVYAEPAAVDAAAWEFADTEKMIEAAERLYGPYRWGRYDLLILPPSFPFGGMENPRLTFATPTIVAGDRSLVSLVAHELAHSWSGNLVTNATWDDFWLNEGFTTYFEQRIMEELYGKEASEMLATLALAGLRDLVAEMGADSPDTRLRLHLAGRNPDDGMTEIAYEKGASFLRLLEETVGRPRWDRFLRSYFEANAFRSLTTDGFLAQLRRDLLDSIPGAEQAVGVAGWVDGPGLPSNVPVPKTAGFESVDAEFAAWRAGRPAARLATSGWNTQQWLRFVQAIPADVDPWRLADLDAAFGFSRSRNSEIACAWFLKAIPARYAPADAWMEDFLIEVGRRKFLRPLYTALARTPDGLERARAIYARARPGYHSVSVATVDEILDWKTVSKP